MRALVIFLISTSCLGAEYFSYSYSFQETKKKYTLGSKGLYIVKDNSGPGECKSFNGKLKKRLSETEKKAFFRRLKN